MNHKKAIAYIRVSTTHQDVERQRIKFKEYCKTIIYKLMKRLLTLAYLVQNLIDLAI